MGDAFVQYEDRGFWETMSDLWASVRDETFVWRQPTPEEAYAQRERRARLFAESHVPWILSDVGQLLGAYDDAQDIVSFTRWSGKLHVGSEIARFIREARAKGIGDASNALMHTLYENCVKGGPRARKIDVAGAFQSLALAPVLPGGLLKAFPKSPVAMYALLAGQVSYSLFGVGIKLGPLMGFASELAIRGLSAVGLPFGPEHNKYHQLKRARLMQQIDKMVGSWGSVHGGDRLLSAQAFALAARDFEPVPSFVLESQDFPSLLNMVTDPWNTFSSLATSLGKTALNIPAYIAGDLLGGAVDKLSELFGGSGHQPSPTPGGLLKASLDRFHTGRCPDRSACFRTMLEAAKLQEWGEPASHIRDLARWQRLANREIFPSFFGADE